VEWTFTERVEGHPPPSIGNWQLPCRSHYVICDSQIVWAGNWTEAQVLSGRRAEEKRRHEYYAARTGNAHFVASVEMDCPALRRLIALAVLFELDLVLRHAF
jgi:hypothetical protein